FDLSAATSGLDDPAYISAAGHLQNLARTGIDTAIDELKLDAIVAPTGSPATKLDLVNGNHHKGGSSTLSAVAGYPILSLPAGYSFGMPIGISFLGRAWSEATLLRLGHAFELATNLRQPPQYLPGSVIPD
ncbi:MAG: amidase family protein, partial [Thermomicrobiales bacterium]